MQNGVGASGVVPVISADYAESFCHVESKCRRILLVYIDFCRSFLLCEINEQRPIAFAPVRTVDEQHLDHVRTLTDETGNDRAVACGVEIDIGEILGNQGRFYFFDILFI